MLAKSKQTKRLFGFYVTTWQQGIVPVVGTTMLTQIDAIYGFLWSGNYINIFSVITTVLHSCMHPLQSQVITQLVAIRSPDLKPTSTRHSNQRDLMSSRYLCLRQSSIAPMVKCMQRLTGKWLSNYRVQYILQFKLEAPASGTILLYTSLQSALSEN